MSTKISITYDDDHHLYQECFENDNVWLELDNADITFESSTGKVTLGIPISTWRSIVEGWAASYWGEDKSLDNDDSWEETDED